MKWWWSGMQIKLAASSIYALFAARHTTRIGPFVQFVPLRSPKHRGLCPSNAGVSAG